nr:MAG TPA: hypothetical protein [Caudoviricetes sp.]
MLHIKILKTIINFMVAQSPNRATLNDVNTRKSGVGLNSC